MVVRTLAACAVAVLCGCPSGNGKPAATTAPRSCPNVVRDPVLPAEMVQDLGTFPVGTDASFVVPAGTGSFVIFSQEIGETAPDTVVVNQDGAFTIPNAVVPRRVIAPGGTVYYDDAAAWPVVTIDGRPYLDVSGVLGYDVGAQSVTGAFAIPNTSAALAATAGAVEPGTWRFTVNDWGFDCPISGCADGNRSGQYRVHVVTRPVVDASRAGTLDLEVYLATDPTSVIPTAAAAEAHPQIARWRESVGAFLANAGIALGRVAFHDLSPDVKDRYAPNGAVNVAGSGPCSELNQLFTAAIVPSRAVHVFLADELVAPSSSGGTRVAGVDGSIPGPSGFPGTIYGGAIVGLSDELGFESEPGVSCSGALDLRDCGTDRLAYVTAHEIGHWLGLYHTTEMEGTFFDPVSDTDRCPCFSCVPAVGPVARSGCAEVNANPTAAVTNTFCTAGPACGGGRNLMFWLLDDDVSTGELSAEQGRIMRLNPAVQ